MEHDYYRVLQVDPSADLETIRKAFRRKAFECHPDRGGSHKKMVLVSEAWEILSNSETRQRYDQARAAHAARSTLRQASKDALSARQKAEQYPRRWEEFQRWLDTIARDFAEARHHSLRTPYGEIPDARIENSVSGVVFVVGGAIVGLVLLYAPAAAFIASAWAQPSLRVQALAVIGPLLIGAMVGAALHKAISDMAKPKQRSMERSAGGGEGKVEITRAVIGCKKCGQQLRVPVLGTEIEVTCPACRYKFSFHAPRCSNCGFSFGLRDGKCAHCGHGP